MGYKLSAKEVAIKSEEGFQFSICHNCNGVEVVGDMKLSEFNHAKGEDLSCTECEKRRLSNKKRKASKAERREIKRKAVDEVMGRILAMESEYGIIYTGCFDWKEVIGKIFDTQVKHLRKIGYQVLVYGDGAAEVIVSKKPLPKEFEKTYHEIFNEFEAMSLNEPSTTADRFNEFNEFVTTVMNLITEPVV
jgi:hypothetical protein